MAPRIGQTVRYHQPNTSNGTASDASYEPYVVAAIVTMTPEEWQPGYRETDGTWVPQTNVTQPADGCVHLHVFYPPGVAAAAQSDVKDVPCGDKPGCYELLPA
jgi:hypothetical protein